MELTKEGESFKLDRIREIKKTFAYIRIRLAQASSPVKLSDLEKEILKDMTKGFNPGTNS